ncbi:MAG TPA: cytidylate kinase family protein [Candidatus Nitrosotalea sp.]|nr:AAA family ATPase [Nitrososphaerota archaeon]HKU33248.1 cytidylate kinase family protein [Candidatus Nitrosotalea sp.]
MLKSIIISGPPAIGKTTIAIGLAKEFGLKYLSGGDVLKDMAKEKGFQTEGDDFWDTEAGMKFLNMRKGNSEFDKLVDEKLKKIFVTEDVVITSYTLPWLVQDGIKIWLAGSQEISAKRMTTRDNISYDDAFGIVKKRYEENKMIYKKLYGFNFGDDLSVFNEIINTDGLGPGQVLELAKEKVKKHYGAQTTRKS